MLCVGLQDPDSVSPLDMTSLNHVQVNLSPLHSSLSALARAIDGLDRAYGRWVDAQGHTTKLSNSKWNDVAINYRSKISSHQANLDVIERKGNATAQLLTNILELHGRNIARQQNDRVLLLTMFTVDDSVTVRVITAITLVFLSFTAVAVSRTIASTVSRSLD